LSRERARRRVRVRGRVQGVFFRAETRARAESLAVGGWVRNTPDGSVEAVFEGEPERVDSMVDWCRRGPAGAVVDDVEVVPEEPAGESGFRVR
jgi:acylphosphatase